MRATVGEMIHYYDASGNGPFAAVVTAAADGSDVQERVDLTVFWPPRARPANCHAVIDLSKVPRWSKAEAAERERKGTWLRID